MANSRPTQSWSSKIGVWLLPHNSRMCLKNLCLTPGGFGETVAVNRGMLVKTFDNLEDGLGWLGIALANKRDGADG